MSHSAKVIHHVRGRIRLKVAAGRCNRDLLEQMQQAISPIAGVRNVTVNPNTGSVLVEYDHTQHQDFHQVLAQHGQSENLFVLQAPAISEVDELAVNIEREAQFLAAHSDLARQVVDGFNHLNHGLRRATNNSVDLKVLLPLGLALYTVLELEADVATPLWVTLGMFSFNSFISLHASRSDVEIKTDQVIRTTSSEIAGRATSVRSSKRRAGDSKPVG